MGKLIIILNNFLQKAWLSKNFLLHKLSDCAYTIACFGYKIINIPSKKYRETVILESGRARVDVTKISKNMFKVWFIYGILPQEYIGFNFEHCNKNERKSYISHVNGAKYCTILNDLSYYHIFKYKYETYLKYKKYYKREVIKAKNINKAFITRHPEFIFKPEDGQKGFQCKVIRANDYQSIETMKSAFPNWDKGICEEIIVQGQWAAMFHSKSVNTCRIQTFIKEDDKVEIFGGFFRMGRGNSIIDNAYSGGILANIDVKKGELNSDGYDERGHVFLNHPESNITIKGVQIPKWKELCEIVKDLALITPKMRIIGWDMVLTDNGWIMVEANAFGAFAQQYATKRGIKSGLLNLISN